MTKQVLFWRRLDVEGLERMELVAQAAGMTAASTVLGLSDGGFRIDHHWQLDPAWRTLSLMVERWQGDRHDLLRLERRGAGWAVDGRQRPDLDGAKEPDLSVTPFCNTLPILRTPRHPGARYDLDTAYVDAATMTVVRSRQRYVRLAGDKLRYVDLGAAAGFEADLTIDHRGLVLHYQHLFERVTPGAGG